VNDFQSWNDLKVEYFNNEWLYLDAGGIVRVGNDVSEVILTDLWQTVGFHVHENIDVAAAYEYINLYRLATDSLGTEHRPSVMVIPHVKINDWVSWKQRNKLEFRMIDGVDEVIYRLRIRPQFTFTLPKEWETGPLESVYINNEWLVNLDPEVLYTQDRFVPLGLTFRLYEGGTFSLYYMANFVYQPDGSYEPDNIIGTCLNFKL